MRTTKIILTLLLLTLFAQAGNDRSIYRKNYGKENKVALVIGNSSYTHFTPLKNTLNDAKDMRNVLKAKGFDVLFLEDGDLESMETMVEKFSSKLRKGGVGFFYYAGHGLEVNGKNYLVPVGADISKKNKVKYKSLPINLVIDEMEDSHNRLNIIVLDACRNDPFSRGGGGLAQINNAKGMYIAFATAPGKVASDGGSQSNGLFTGHLIKHIKQSDLTLNEVFKKTRASVYQESNEEQMPWTSSSVIGDFYFQVDPLDTPTTPPVSAPVTSEGLSETDKAELARFREDKRANELTELEQLRKEKKEREAQVQREEEAAAVMQREREAKAEKVRLAEKERERLAEREQLAEAEREAKRIAEASNTFSLTITTEPSNAKVQITNIKPRYSAGMKLKKGTYKIKVSRKGYGSIQRSIVLKKDLTHRVKLVKEKPKRSGKEYSNLGTKYYFGRGVTKNYTKAREYYSKACSMGEKSGCSDLGYLYHYGRGININYAKAKKYYTKACGMGDREACNGLGHLYYKGQGVTQNYAKARSYYNKACNMGYKKGCSNYQAVKDK